MQTFSTAMEHSLSWRGLRWRWDAWRTGRPMAEVVLYHTLLYRVEQVFLIHRPSGLLLLHVEVPGVGTGDEDLVAGMLSAVRDFVQDSFSRSSDEELHSVQVGDRSVWVEPGPHAILAGAIRGHAPLELRQRFLDSLEKVHAMEGPALAAFRGGEVSGFESLRETLESCLEERKREGEQTGVVSWKAAVALSIVLLGLLAWWGYGWLERGRDAALVSRLRAEPGILVTHAHRQEGRLRIEGLRDGLSADPWALVAAAGLSTQRVEFRWEPYLALSPEMVLRRVRGRVETPGSVSLSWKDGVLGVSGVASADWWSAAREGMSMVAGVSGVDASGLVLERSETWEDIARALAGRVVLFGPARNAAEGQEGVLREVAAAMQRAVTLSRGDARDLVLRIVGHTDRSGADAMNTRLSAQRAEWVRDRLVDLGLAREGMEVAGAGSRTPASGVDPSAGENRRVTFSVERRR
ncbi:MAG: OmpA family protein [Verrucomicrobiales bacterium]|nr:OmpA family protein [Verrucomicrobiales bacterium]